MRTFSLSRILAAAILCLIAISGLAAQDAYKVETQKDENGWKLLVDGRDFPVKGVVWSYTPVGQNYAYDLWTKPDSYIEKMIDTDMTLLKKMGTNAIRCFSIIPPRWVSYIYDRYGIYTIVDDMLGRYGLTVNGKWMAKTDYSDPEVRKVLLAQFAKTVADFKDVRGVLFFLLGNESNYGLEWSSTAIENLPSGERLEAKAHFLYSLFEEAIKLGKAADANHPFGIVNGDTQYLGVIKKECPSLDIFGINSYRGKKAYDLFYSSVANSLDKPIVYTEIGADAFNVGTNMEDQFHQAEIIQAQWEEMYSQAWGKGKSQNLIGACMFEWVDEWWKHGMETGLEVHDTAGTWNNGAYEFDSVPGKLNMNEEWFGLAAQSTLTRDGINRRIPRAAYYVLQKIWNLDLYYSSAADVKKTFAVINPAELSVGAVAESIGNSLAEQKTLDIKASITARGYLSATDRTLTDFETMKANSYFKRNETAKLGFAWTPLEGLAVGADLRIFGEQFFPSATTRDSFLPPPADAARSKNDSETVELYSGYANFDSEIIKADLYYHNGHPDWYGEGDFFTLLPEAFDTYTMDQNASKAPFGLELRPKGFLDGLTVYAGPELYYGGFPMLMAKYYKDLGIFAFALEHQEELAYPMGFKIGGKTEIISRQLRPLTRASSLYLETDFLPVVKAQLGALLSRPDQINKTYAKVLPAAKGAGSGYAGSNWDLYENQPLSALDALAGKLRLSTEIIPYTQLYLQGIYAGAVADAKAMIPRGGSQIADIGLGNRIEGEAGAVVTIGPFSLAPKFLYRQPVIAPLPDIDAKGTATALTPRDYTNPFHVGANRATTQAELVLGWDPTGATYLFDWNNDEREDAPIAASLSFLYNFYQGPTDAKEFISATGATYVWAKGGTAPDGSVFTHAGLAEIKGTWSALARLVSNPVGGFRFILTGTAGQGQSSSIPDDKLVTYYGGGLKMAIDRLMVEGALTLGGWGPENWYREFNKTYLSQWNVGLAYGFTPLSFMNQNNRFGLSLSGQWLDQYSDPNTATPTAAAPNITNRLELQAYINLTF